MKKLTEREEHVLQILWELGEGFVKDVIAEFPDPKPPYNTISSIIRILEEKGYVDHKAYGKTHLYFPVVSRKAYRKTVFKKLVSNFFEGSVENVVSHMVNEGELDRDELQKLKTLIEDLEKKGGGGNV